jgi:nucleotide-binding universal stress UspA family protein
MSFKTLMVHLDDTEGCRLRLDAAVSVAIHFGAQLVGVYIVPGLEMSPSVAALLPAEAVDRRLSESGEAQRRAEQVFRSAASAAGIEAEFRAPAGPAMEAAAANGRCTDLFVIGQADRQSPQFDFAGDLLTTVVLSSGRPSLIVPNIGAPLSLGDNVLIAWDASKEAGRAIADAMPFLERARNVRVLAVNRDDQSAGDDGAISAARLTSWLIAHGVGAEIERDDVPDVGIADWLLSRAADFDCDLIVMGGYGHARMREVILGGVTRSMLHSMTVPVLMSH